MQLGKRGLHKKQKKKLGKRVKKIKFDGWGIQSYIYDVMIYIIY